MDLNSQSNGFLLHEDDGAGISVSDFTRQVKNLLEEQFLRVSVFGEISNLKRQASGHVYFSLKDAESQVAAVLFRGDAMRSKLELRDGMQVLIEGSVSVYLPRGSYQIIARRVRELGKGSLREQFERLKQKLAAEGLFDAAGKQELPLLPQRIGIVTSPTGAVIRDFVSIVQRLRWNGTVLVFPARVQGKEALSELIQSIRQANRPEYRLDLLVLARGGGSLEDLWNFNEESLVREIAASRLPVISAIGHETDFTLADFVADFRAETPSAAAERVASGMIEYRQKLAQLTRQLRREMRLILERKVQQIQAIQRRLLQVSPGRMLMLWRERMQRMEIRVHGALAIRVQRERDRVLSLQQRQLRASPQRVIAQHQEQLALKQQQWLRLGQHWLERSRERTEVLGRRLNQVGPEVTLKRGFAMVESTAGGVVTDAATARREDLLRIRMRDGRVEVKVLSSDSSPT